MALTDNRLHNYRIYGLSTDAKPTGIPVLSDVNSHVILHEIDTGDEYLWEGAGVWTLIFKPSKNKVWDPVALSWVAETQSLVSTDTLNVDADITDDATRVLGQVSGVPEAIVTYQSGTDLYLCTAAPGSAVASAVWRVMKLDSSSGSVIKWADGNANYDNLASDLATVAGLSYS